MEKHSTPTSALDPSAPLTIASIFLSKFHVYSSIYILLGESTEQRNRERDVYYSLIWSVVIRIHKNVLTLSETHLGYCTSGSVTLGSCFIWKKCRKLNLANMRNIFIIYNCCRMIIILQVQSGSNILSYTQFHIKMIFTKHDITFYNTNIYILLTLLL